MSRLTIHQLEPIDILTYHDAIVDAYAEVFGEAPWNEGQPEADAFAESLYYYAGWPGFRAIVAVDDTGVVQGFALGADWIHDNWWCEAVERSLGPRTPAWTNHCFHLMELAVRKAHRGEGYGNEIYDALVADLPHRTAILSTNKLGPIAAATLYARRGWRLLLEQWQHCDDCDPVQVLGLLEPAMSARSSA